jgi:hypothetical protein
LEMSLRNAYAQCARTQWKNAALVLCTRAGLSFFNTQPVKNLMAMSVENAHYVPPAAL